jgi:hypothetical protein
VPCSNCSASAVDIRLLVSSDPVVASKCVGVGHVDDVEELVVGGEGGGRRGWGGDHSASPQQLQRICC